MRNTKKTPKEKAKTRHEQNQRAAKKKAALGLQRVSLWIPNGALEEAEKRNLSRIGIVFAEPEADQRPTALVRTADGKIEALPYAKTLFEA